MLLRQSCDDTLCGAPEWPTEVSSPNPLAPPSTLSAGEVDSLTRAGKFEASVAAADAFASARGADVAAGQVPDLDTVDLELLRAKARVSWPGHEDEALALYDALVGASREDFRPLLGKGLALASMGRSADAERALIEARFLAPRDARPLVDKAIRAAQK